MAKKSNRNERVKAEQMSPKLVKGDERIMPITEIDRFIQEEEERQARRNELIEQLLAERQDKLREYDDKLKLLGYKPLQRPLPISEAKDGKTVREKKDAPCTICGFKTNPPHDARSHRQQNPKAPFTDQELESKQLAKVG